MAENNIFIDNDLFYTTFWQNFLHSRYLSPGKIKLLKFELALHSHSPKIEMFQQIAKDRGINKMPCENVLDINGELSCEIKEDIPFAIDMNEMENDHR